MSQGDRGEPSQRPPSRHMGQAGLMRGEADRLERLASRTTAGVGRLLVTRPEVVPLPR